MRKPRKGRPVEPPTDDPIDKRFARIEGQVVGVRNMAREKRNCVDILTQLAAIRAALDQVGIEFLTHLMNECANGEGCLPEAETMDESERRQEVRTALNRFVK